MVATALEGVCVPGALIVTATALDDEGPKTAVPEYVATIVWFPAGKVEIVRVAMLEERAAVPITCGPSRKVTVPVGEDAAFVAFTLAVRVSAEPRGTVFDDAVSVVEVLETTALTVTVTAPEAEGLKPLDPT